MLLGHILILALTVFCFLSDMLSTMNEAVCIVLNRGTLGDELVVLENMKIDLYNFANGSWRHGPATAQVSVCASVIH